MLLRHRSFSDVKTVVFKSVRIRTLFHVASLSSLLLPTSKRCCGRQFWVPSCGPLQLVDDFFDHVTHDVVFADGDDGLSGAARQQQAVA